MHKPNPFFQAGSQFPWLLLIVAVALLVAPELLAAGADSSAHPNHDQEGGAGVLKFLPNVLFWEYVAFAIILGILGAYIFPILYKQLDQRAKNIKDALDKADMVRAEAETLLQKHQEMMRRANEDAKKIIDEAVVAGRQARERIEQAATQASEEIKSRAAREVQLMQDKLRAELREQAVELALIASSQVLQKSLTNEDHRALARQAIEAAATLRN